MSAKQLSKEKGIGDKTKTVGIYSYFADVITFLMGINS
jgi:hypothetical protein